MYTPPLGDTCTAALSGGYLPPAGDALQAHLGETLEVVDGGCELACLYADHVASGCLLRTAIAGGRAESAATFVCVVADERVEAAAEVWRPHAIEATTLVARGAAVSISAAVRMVRGPAVAVDRGCDLVRPEWLEVAGEVGVVLTLAADLVDGGCVLDRRHATLTPIETGCVLVALDASAPGLHQVVSLPATTIDGRVITSLIGLRLMASRDSHAVTGSLDLGDPVEWAAISHGDQVRLTLAGRAVSLRVTDRARVREHGGWRYTVSCESPSTWLDAPHAEPLTTAALSGRAATLAATLAGAVPLTWSTLDWNVPADGLPAAGQTPLALLRSLAAAPGAVCTSTWEGGLVVAPEYPRPVPTWPTAAPDLVVREAAEVLSATDDDDWRGGYDSYLLGAAAAGAESSGDLRLDVIDNDDGSKTLRAAAVPWDGSLTLSHRGGPWVQLSLLGDQTRTETETVQIVDGVGRCRYPVQAILARDWLEHELGALTAAADGQLTSATVGDSLVSVSYTTRARVWTILDPHDEEVMVVAETAGAAAGAGVSVLVTRGSGDRRGEDVVDPLLTAEPVARERGRNLIDAASTRRQIVTLTCPFTALHDHGSLVEVREAADGPWRGMLRGQEVALAVGDDGTPTWDTVLTIERESC